MERGEAVDQWKLTNHIPLGYGASNRKTNFGQISVEKNISSANNDQTQKPLEFELAEKVTLCFMV